MCRRNIEERLYCYACVMPSTILLRLRLLAICVMLWYRLRMRQRRRRIRRLMNRRNRSVTAICTMKRLHKRRPWIKERSKDFWHVIVPKFSDYDWLENFRMTKNTFDQIVSIVSDEMSPASEFVRKPIPLEMRVGIAIYKLASSGEYRSVANTFGVGISTVQKYVQMLPQFIFPPAEDEAKAIALRIEQKYGFPQVFGCLDGSHMDVTAPTIGKRDYQNRKGGESIVLQAIVDDKCCFWDINVTMPGSCHDAYVFKNSRLYENSNILPKAPVIINGVQVPLLILADPAYPLLPWVQKPYIGPHLTPEKESYNAYLSSVRILIENAFGKLKTRWRMIGKKLETRIDLAPQVIATCCVLHNICERADTPLIDDWRVGSSTPIRLATRPSISSHLLHTPDQSQTSPNLGNAAEVRHALTTYIATNLPLRTTLRP